LASRRGGWRARCCVPRPRRARRTTSRTGSRGTGPAYLVTKAIGAGAFLVAAAGLALKLFPETPLFTAGAAALALLATLATTALLVADLDRPERFWTILTRPQWRSWLVRGAWILIAFSIAAAVSLAAPLFGAPRVAARSSRGTSSCRP
jgi:formate-dependent nitrite reductase membrane component NrfD